MPNFKDLIERNLSPTQSVALRQVSEAALRLQWPLYLVGGFVRDAFLGLTPDDFDLVVEGSAPQLAAFLAKTYGGEALVHAPFGTATWTSADSDAIDLASARTETYAKPAALPTVSTPATIEADLRRRDFTINTLTMRVDGEHYGELLDPLDGHADLTRGIVRVLHPRSFVDDPTRLFRAVRYEQRLNFHIAAETLALISEAWDSLAVLTGSRLRHELELIFREPRASAMLERLQSLNVLQHVHPALRWGSDAMRRAEVIRTLPIADWKLPEPPEPTALYLTLLLAEASEVDIAETLNRLNVSRTVSEAVPTALTLSATWTRPSEAVARLDAVSELAIIAAYVLRGHPDLSTYLSRWRFVRATMTGDDLIARGFKPGPDFKSILWQLRAARLDGWVQTEAEELAWLNQVTP